MSTYVEKFDSETRQVITYLKSKSEICDFYIKEYQPADPDQINEWEIKNFCKLPQDLKSFYLNHDGFLIEWSFKLQDGRTPITLGKLQINSIKDLTKVGSVLFKDYKEPSVFDLEDLQEPPEEFLATNELTEDEENKNHNDYSDNKSVEILDDQDQVDSDENSSQNNDSNQVVNDKKEHYESIKTLVPHFDDSSRNFELENCGGYGKVCLVYRNTKAGLISCEQSAEIWFLDRSLQWHYLTNSFSNYYRLLISHLGLPQWQTLFTQDGLPPNLYQWYYLLTPGRILVHENNWKKLEFLSLLENNYSYSTNKKIDANQQAQIQNGKTKIDFNKLFDTDKQSKSKTQNNQNPIHASASENSNYKEKHDQTNTNSKSLPRSKSRPNITRNNVQK